MLIWSDKYRLCICKYCGFISIPHSPFRIAPKNAAHHHHHQQKQTGRRHAPESDLQRLARLPPELGEWRIGGHQHANHTRQILRPEGRLCLAIVEQNRRVECGIQIQVLQLAVARQIEVDAEHLLRSRITVIESR